MIKIKPLELQQMKQEALKHKDRHRRGICDALLAYPPRLAFTKQRDGGRREDEEEEECGFIITTPPLPPSLAPSICCHSKQ